MLIYNPRLNRERERERITLLKVGMMGRPRSLYHIEAMTKKDSR